jgi:hypothetical protein
MRALLSAAALVAALASASCGGGGGGGGGGSTPTEPPVRQSSVVFTPASSSTGISLSSGAGGGPTTLVLELRATGVGGLYGVAFDLTYPATLLRFDGVERGGFLGSATDTTLAQAQPAPGTLVIGYSRLGEIPGVSGSGNVLTLRFTSLATGSGTFTFSRNSAFNAEGNPLQSLPWAGGSVQVTLLP